MGLTEADLRDYISQGVGGHLIARCGNQISVEGQTILFQRFDRRLASGREAGNRLPRHWPGSRRHRLGPSARSEWPPAPLLRQLRVVGVGGLHRRGNRRQNRAFNGVAVAGDVDVRGTPAAIARTVSGPIGTDADGAGPFGRPSWQVWLWEPRALSTLAWSAQKHAAPPRPSTRAATRGLGSAHARERCRLSRSPTRARRPG